MILLLSLLAAAVDVEISTVGEVSAAVQEPVKQQVEQAITELLLPTDDTLAIVLIAGAISTRCIATRRSTGASLEIDLVTDRPSLRPKLDELVLGLFPERVKKTVPIVETPAPPPERPLRLAPWIATGATAAILIAGIALGVHARLGGGDLLDDPMDGDDFRATRDRVQAESIAADALYLGAALGAVLSLALFLDD